MARQGITKSLEGNKPEFVFDAAQVTFKELGWEVYKKRPFAFLVEARTTTSEGYILANIIITVFGNPGINLTIKSDTASQATVDDQARKIMAALEKNISKKK